MNKEWMDFYFKNAKQKKKDGIRISRDYITGLGLTATEVGKHLGLSKSAISRAANRGQKLIVNQFLSLKGYKRAISTPFSPSLAILFQHITPTS